VIEEGHNGRTTVFFDPIEVRMAGIDYFYPCIVSQSPLDLIILMLGTNDLLLGDTPSRMGRKWQAVLERCKEHLSGRVVLMTPPPMKDMNKAEKTALCKAYETAAQAYGLTFFDTVHLPMQLHFDQIHMLPEDHSLLAEALYPVVVRLIQEEKENAHH
jgi:lysophospholipase L1-like esterase